MRPETDAIRAQRPRGPEHEHAVPVFLTTGYVFDSGAHAAAVFNGDVQGNRYARLSNPNVDEFATKVALLEGAERALATASGMSAVFASIAGIVSAGDHIVGAEQVFGSTHALFTQILPRFGIETTIVDLTDSDAWLAAIRPNTKMFVLESPSNPGLAIADLAAIIEIAHRHDILVNIDNCFTTPVLQRPIQMGADIVVHSATKFMDGQGRVLGGVIASTAELIDRIMPFYKHTGPTLSAFNAWLLSRSLETLHVRMERHCANALTVAQFLQEHPRVRTVRYPGLASHPQYELAMRQMSAGGALVTFELDGGTAAAMDVLDRLKVISRSVNLGDTRTIATHPATTTHGNVDEAVRERLGITSGLIRLSVGLEDTQDIREDLDAALG